MTDTDKGGGPRIPNQMDDKTKSMIDAMTYEEMLHRWRSAPIGDSMFRGETGKYYVKAMRRKRAEVGDNEHVRASKRIDR